jgi:hypothetical protein
MQSRGFRAAQFLAFSVLIVATIALVSAVAGGIGGRGDPRVERDSGKIHGVFVTLVDRGDDIGVARPQDDPGTGAGSVFAISAPRPVGERLWTAKRSGFAVVSRGAFGDSSSSRWQWGGRPNARRRESVMAFVTTGLTNGGVTTHYKFSYDASLAGSGGVEPARTNAVIAACEADYDLMSSWFGGGLTVTGMTVQVTTQSNGASWSGSSTSSVIQLKAQGAAYSSNPAYLRYLLFAEVTEILMMTQNAGWFQGSDEGSKGEGLSRFLSGQFLAMNGLLGIGIDADYAVANLWLNSPRQDFVNTAPDDNGYNATNGCTTLFIYYLFHQLGYGAEQIVSSAGATLADVYRNLTGDPNDPFPLFKQLLDTRFPSQTGSAVAGPNFDDPWPLGDIAWSGVWRAGNRPYYLWIHASQSEFLTKWQTLASQELATHRSRHLNGEWPATLVGDLGGRDGRILHLVRRRPISLPRQVHRTRRAEPPVGEHHHGERPLLRRMALRHGWILHLGRRRRCTFSRQDQ